MSTQIQSIEDNRHTDENEIGVTIEAGDSVYHVKFAQFDTGEYVPTEIISEESTVRVGDMFSILRKSISAVEAEIPVAVPFNQPGFGGEK